MEQAGLRPEVIEGDPASRLASRDALIAYAAQYGCPDALFCFNDEIALSACRALREIGLRVPEDVLVVGCDGSEESEYAFPSLSTIAQPLDTMCDLAWTFMIQRLAQPALPRQHAAVDANFLVRGSSHR